MTRFELALASLLIRNLLLAALVLALLVSCFGCMLLAYSLRIQPEYTVSWHTFSAGILINECNLQFGYYDELSKINNSIEWHICK